MRDHATIIEDAGGATKFAAALTAATLAVDSAAETIDANLAAAWKREKSIPGAYWPRVVDAGFASHEELALAAERKKFPRIAERRARAAA